MHEEDTGRVAGKLCRKEPVEQRGWAQSVMMLMSSGIPPGGLLSTVFNLSSICIGAGILGLPFAAKQQWPRFGACVSGPHWGSHRLLPVLPRGADGATWLEDVRRHGTCAAGSRLRLCHCRATLSEHLWRCVSFIISVGDIFKAILDNTSAPAYWKSKSGNRLLTSLLWLTVMLPLVIPRHINSLRHISAVGIVFSSTSW
ncbi:putative amino acid transporter [Trypanosoma cruzi]|uniref:Putative amino acid transporter n=1 Tax=Trypanosoma cruzi TaxID=5693 RepID=A0A2V2UT71_TRYCR|nr:putative amino acid transporter [Trypanosoma cruzi]